MRIPSLPYDEARRLPGARWVDLRSPAEFARDHVPGARNVPLFDDEQRAVVGTLYQQVSPEAAYEEGLEFAAAHMGLLLERVLGRPVARAEWEPRFRALAGRLRAGQKSVEAAPASREELATRGDGGSEETLVLHCWRGGMRSRSVAALLAALGERPVLLEGGYKAYRSWVRQRLAELPHWPHPLDAGAGGGASPFVVIAGPTGVGKTRILRALEERAPGTTLDLEGLARHRSSILGAVGLDPVGQARFESRLVARFAAIGPPPWFVEAESRKVGDVVIPEGVWRAMRTAPAVRVDAGREHRVAVLVEDYVATPGHVEQIAAKLPFLERRLGQSWTGRLRAWLEAGEPERVAETLLERYYDPRYRRSGRDLRPGWELRAEQPDLLDRLLEIRAAVAADVAGKAAGAARSDGIRS